MVIATPSFWPTGGYTSQFPILTVQVLEGRPPPVVVMGVLRERVEALLCVYDRDCTFPEPPVLQLPATIGAHVALATSGAPSLLG